MLSEKVFKESYALFQGKGFGSDFLDGDWVTHIVGVCHVIAVLGLVVMLILTRQYENYADRHES